MHILKLLITDIAYLKIIDDRYCKFENGVTWTNFCPAAGLGPLFCAFANQNFKFANQDLKLQKTYKNVSKYFYSSLVSATCVRKELWDTTCKTILVLAQLCVWPRESPGWVVGGEEGEEGGELTRGRFGPNLPICLLSPNHPICLLSPSRFSHSTDSYFHPLVFFYLSVVFHDKYQSYKYEQIQHGNLPPITQPPNTRGENIWARECQNMSMFT